MGKNNVKEIVDTLLALEESTNYKLPVVTTLACRVDGIGFSEFTKDLEKPFDDDFQLCMQQTMLDVAKLVQGCFYAYSQSDEITFLIRTIRGQGNYYANRVQKLSSVIASMTSIKFYKHFQSVVNAYKNKAKVKEEEEENAKIENRINVLQAALDKDPMFDCRVFTIPDSETYNLICYRQHNCSNNALQMMAHYYLKNVNKMKYKEVEQALKDSGHDFDLLDAKYKLGVCCHRDENGSWVVENAQKFYYDKGTL